MKRSELLAALKEGDSTPHSLDIYWHAAVIAKAATESSSLAAHSVANSSGLSPQFLDHPDAVTHAQIGGFNFP
jgi:hypothetical protein